MRLRLGSISLAFGAAALAGCGSSAPQGSAGTSATTSSSGSSGGAPGSSTGGVGPSSTAAGGTSTSGAGGGAAGTSSEAGAPEAGLGDASTADTGDAAISLPVPSRDEYLKTLYELSDLLLSTQIDRPGDPNDGALVSPSTNPDPNPIHSRAAEAVYPFAVAYKNSQNAKYADAAIRLGNWLVGIQSAAGSWIE